MKTYITKSRTGYYTVKIDHGQRVLKTKVASLNKARYLMELGKKEILRPVGEKLLGNESGWTPPVFKHSI